MIQKSACPAFFLCATHCTTPERLLVRTMSSWAHALRGVVCTCKRIVLVSKQRFSLQPPSHGTRGSLLWRSSHEMGSLWRTLGAARLGHIRDNHRLHCEEAEMWVLSNIRVSVSECSPSECGPLPETPPFVRMALVSVGVLRETSYSRTFIRQEMLHQKTEFTYTV